MLTVARSSRATKCTARRGDGAVGCPIVRGTFLRGRFFGHTHTLEEDGMGPPPLSRTSTAEAAWRRAPAQCRGTGRRRSPEHGLERGGVTTPQAGRTRRRAGISRSPTTPSQQHDLASRPPAPSDPGLPEAAAAAPGEEGRARNEELVARARRTRWFFPVPVPVLPARRMMPPSLPFEATRSQQPQPAVVVIPEGGGAKPPPPSSTSGRI